MLELLQINRIKFEDGDGGDLLNNKNKICQLFCRAYVFCAFVIGLGATGELMKLAPNKWDKLSLCDGDGNLLKHHKIYQLLLCTSNLICVLHRSFKSSL